MPTDLQKARELFLHAVGKLPPEQWDGYVAEACGGDAGLEQQVGHLLQVHREAGSFLDRPAVAVGATGAFTPMPGEESGAVSLRERPGTIIGPYKLLQQIGEGGMGTVFMAEQTHPVQRKVALKVIKAGMDSKQVIARFEAERQALAMMDHVNIARVLDAGATEAGLPYFVMELVHGVPITKYCDDNHLTPRERLELFVPVCQAIQHAHQKGIIHRDVKPSNVMITLYDGKPVPKVIDFGVAKATEQKLTERTLFTQYGTMVGTLEYMSPEQAEMSALGVDTRSDIFSLGVLLYELLTGNTPLTHKRMKEGAHAEILRMIKEEEPPKPSTRLSESGEALASISAQRHMEPAKLTKLVRGELDWIVMKTLEKDRNRRYETAKDFAADVQRYLADEPVQACPPSVGYRLRKFARRNKVVLVTATMVAASLVLGTLISVWQAIRATEASGQAMKNENTAKAQAKLARENLVQARQVVDKMLTRVAEERLANMPQMTEVRLELLQDALQFYEEFLKQDSDHPEMRLETALAQRRVADIHFWLRQDADAESAYRSTIARLNHLKTNSVVGPRARAELVMTHLDLAWTVGNAGNRKEKEKNIRQAVQLAEELVADFPAENSDYRTRLAQAGIHLVQFLNPMQAEQLLKRNLTLTVDPQILSNSYSRLARVFTDDGRLVEAEKANREAVNHSEKLASDPQARRTSGYHHASRWPDNHLASHLRRLASSIAANGRPEEAEQIHQRALNIMTKLARDFPSYAHYRSSLGRAYTELAATLQAMGKAAEAEHADAQALDVFAKLALDFPTVQEHQKVALHRSLTRGRFLLKAGRVDEAQEVYTKAEAFLEKLDADATVRFKRWQELAQAHVEIARRWSANAKAEEAKPAFRKMIAILDKLEAEYGGQDEYRGALAKSNVSAGWLLHETRQHLDGREKLARRAQAHVQAVAAQLAGDSGLRHTLAGSHHLLAHVLAQTARAKEGEVEFRQALALYEKLARELPEVAGHRISLAHVHNGLGRLLRNKDIAAAEQEHRQALALFEALSNDMPADSWRQHDRAMMLENVGVVRRNRGDLTGARALLEQAIVYAQKACDLDANSQAFRDRLRSSRAELATTLKAHESEKKDTPE